MSLTKLLFATREDRKAGSARLLCEAQGRSIERKAWPATNYCSQNERCIVSRSSYAGLRRIQPGVQEDDDMAPS